jgi:hypothetical protein
MRFSRLLPKLAVAAALGCGALLLATPHQAEGQRGLRAQVFLTQNRIPRGLSERGLLRFARGHNSRRLRETSDRPIPERQWRAEMIIAFNRPPGDLEFHALFYDVEGGARRFVQDMSTFVNDRSQKTFLQRLRLDRGQGRHDGFQPNRRMEMVVTVRRQEVARRNFELLGEEIRRSGQVTFSEDETD